MTASAQRPCWTQTSTADSKFAVNNACVTKPSQATQIYIIKSSRVFLGYKKNVFNYSYIYSAIMSKQQETGKQSKTTGLWGSTFIFRWTRIAYVNMDKNQHSAGTFHLKIQQNLLSKVIWRSSLITFLIPLPNSMRTIKRHNTSSISTHYRTSTPYSTICSWPRPTCMTSVTSHFPTQFCWI